MYTCLPSFSFSFFYSLRQVCIAHLLMGTGSSTGHGGTFPVAISPKEKWLLLQVAISPNSWSARDWPRLVQVLTAAVSAYVQQSHCVQRKSHCVPPIHNVPFVSSSTLSCMVATAEAFGAEDLTVLCFLCQLKGGNEGTWGEQRNGAHKEPIPWSSQRNGPELRKGEGVSRKERVIAWHAGLADLVLESWFDWDPRSI